MTRQHPHSGQESVLSGQKEVVSMSDPQSLEEAWQRLEHIMDWKEYMEDAGVRDEVDATRALALAAFKLGVNVRTPMGHTWNYEDDEQRRIEELGT